MNFLHFLTEEYNIYNDVTIELQSGKQFHTSRVMLVAAAPTGYFHNIFTFGKGPDLTKPIKFTMFPDHVVLTVLYQMYGKKYEYQSDDEDTVQFELDVLACKNFFQMDISAVIDKYCSHGHHYLTRTVNFLYENSILCDYLMLVRKHFRVLHRASIIEEYPSLAIGAVEMLVSIENLTHEVTNYSITTFENDIKINEYRSTSIINRFVFNDCPIIIVRTDRGHEKKVSIINPYTNSAIATYSISSRTTYVSSGEYIIFYEDGCINAHSIYASYPNNTISSITIYEHPIFLSCAIQNQIELVSCNPDNSCSLRIAGKMYNWNFINDIFEVDASVTKLVVKNERWNTVSYTYEIDNIYVASIGRITQIGPDPLLVGIQELYVIADRTDEVLLGVKGNDIYLINVKTKKWFICPKPYDKFSCFLTREKENLCLVFAKGVYDRTIFDMITFEKTVRCG